MIALQLQLVAAWCQSFDINNRIAILGNGRGHILALVAPCESSVGGGPVVEFRIRTRGFGHNGELLTCCNSEGGKRHLGVNT